MLRYTLKILQQNLQYFLTVSDHFGTLYIKRLSFLAASRQPRFFQ